MFIGHTSSRFFSRQIHEECVFARVEIVILETAMPVTFKSMALMLGVKPKRVLSPCVFGQLEDGSGRLGVSIDNIGWNYVDCSTWQRARSQPIVVVANEIDYQQTLFQRLVDRRFARVVDLCVAHVSIGFMRARLNIERFDCPLPALVLQGGGNFEMLPYEDVDSLREQMLEKHGEDGALVIRQDEPGPQQPLRRAIVITPTSALPDEVFAI